MMKVLSVQLTFRAGRATNWPVLFPASVSRFRVWLIDGVNCTVSELNEKHHISTLIVSLLEIMWRTFDRRATLCPSGSHASDLHRFGPDLTSLLCPTMPPCQPDWLV
jgi:hypothetical protein